MKKTILSMFVATTAVVASFVIAGAVFAVASVTNGGFETGTDPGAFAQVNAPDNTTITGWTVDAGSVDYIGSYWQASDGTRSLDLNGLEAGSVHQTLATTVGAKYVVTFHLSGNPDAGPSAKVARVSASGGTPAFADYTYDTSVKANTKEDMKWESDTFTFVASSASTTLTFASQVAGPAGPALDNVSVAETLPHTISASAGANGTISPSGSVSVTDGNNQTFTISANSGFHINDVLVDSISVGAVSSRTFTNVTANHTISASFAANPPENVAPVLDTITSPVTIPELSAFSFDANGGDTLTFSLSGNPSGSSINSSTGVFAWTPTEAQGAGDYTFTVMVSDGSLSDTQSVTIHVTEVGDDVNHDHDKDDCKKGGWMSFLHPSFKNQGQCIAHMNHHNHNEDGDNEDDD